VINQEELAICKRRGHQPAPYKQWQRCKWCGMWIRSVTTIEEREDDPPEKERDPMQTIRDELEER
jgi:hypothetical protein